MCAANWSLTCGGAPAAPIRSPRPTSTAAIERQRDRLARNRALEVAFVGDDALNARPHAGRQDDDLLAGPHAAAQHGAGIAAKAGVAVDPLHGEPERLVLDRRGADDLEMAEQRRSAVPRHRRTRPHDVVAVQGRDGNGRHVAQAELPGHRRVALDDRGEAVFAVADQVHLVDREHDAADAHQRHDGAVPESLRQQALGRVDQDDREVGRRSPRRHVARVLLVARRVGNDEAPPRRREIAVADVDGDALFAFRLQAVDQRLRESACGLRDDRPARRRHRPGAGRSACSCRRRRCRR